MPSEDLVTETKGTDGIEVTLSSIEELLIEDPVSGKTVP